MVFVYPNCYPISVVLLQYLPFTNSIYSIYTITLYTTYYRGLRTNTAGEPIFLTKNGVGDMVVMSLDYYEKQLARIKLYQKLSDARDEIRNGAKGVEARTFIEGLKDTIY